MIIQKGQPIYFKFKDDPTDGDTPTEFGYVPDPAACSDVEYLQLVDQTDTSYIQIDLDETFDVEELQSPNFSSSTGWTLGTGWTIASGVASITDTPTVQSLSQGVFDTARIRSVYKAVVEVNSVSGDVEVGGVLGFEEKLSEGTNVFYFAPPNPSLFSITAFIGSSIEIDSVSVKKLPSSAILSFWDNDGNYQGELQSKTWEPTSPEILKIGNQILFGFNYSDFAVPDGCYYFSILDPYQGQQIGDGGLANGEFNVGNPNVNDMYLWTKTLGSGSTIVGGTGICTYTSPNNTSSTVTSTFSTMRQGVTYSVEIKVNSISNAAVAIKCGGSITVAVTSVGTFTRTITPLATGAIEILFADSAVGSSCVLDYVRVTLDDGQDLFTNNASNKIKLGTHECTHLIKACPGEAFGFIEGFQLRYRVFSKITGSAWKGERIQDRLSTGERILGYSDSEELRLFTTDLVPYPELQALFRVLQSKVVQIDGVRYWIDTDPEDFEPQYQANDTEHGSITFEIVEYDQIIENRKYDGLEPICD